MSNNDSLKKKKIDKGYIIGLLICLLVCTFITSLVILQEVYGQNRNFSKEYLIILTDGFTISGGLMCLFYLLVFVSDEGAFDIITYSVKLVWNVTFHKNVRETNLPRTYAEYRELKRSKPRTNSRFMLFSGLIFFIIGLIFMILYFIYL